MLSYSDSGPQALLSSVFIQPKTTCLWTVPSPIGLSVC